MRVTVVHMEKVYPLDVSEELELENVKALLEFESGIPATDFFVSHNGVPLMDVGKTLRDLGVKDGEILVMVNQARAFASPQQSEISAAGIDWSGIRIPSSTSTNTSQSSLQRNGRQGIMGNIDPLVLREMLMLDSYQRSILRERNPPLSEALESGNPQQFVSVFERQQKAREEQDALRKRMARADPFDIEAQQKIAEEIQMANINANMEAAMEFSPESFGQVVMLYINCKVNGQPVKAFVDSGAQMTIMSVACAERCNIMRLVDRRWAGLAKGVGTQKIIGRVHVAQIQIEQDYLASSFSVLESQPMDMLLGLDMLKRHQIGTTGTVTSFLPEVELPECARLSGPSLGTHEMEDRDLAEALTRSVQDAPSSSSSGSSSHSTTHGFQSALPSLPRNVSETDIQRLMNMGLNREDIIKELSKNGGDINKAAAVLLARSLIFKPK